MMNTNQPIGLFDSGVGGLTIARAIATKLPHEQLIYFGDTKHLPYGDKSPSLIQQYARDISAFLLNAHCKAIVIACNTASANALGTVRQLAAAHQAVVLDVITPVAAAAATMPYREIGVIATKATIASGLYREKIIQHNAQVCVHELPTPLLAPLIEEGLGGTAVSRAALAHYLAQPTLAGIDSLILGCTHYPLLEADIRAYYHNRIAILDSPTIVADALYRELQQRGLCATSAIPRHHQFFVSDMTTHFRTLASHFFGDEINLTLQPIT